MAFDSSRLPAAYQEEGPEAYVIGPEDLVSFDDAEPSPVMLFFQRWWRRTITMMKVGVVVGAVALYPVMTVTSSKIDDSSVFLESNQNWAWPEAGVAITKIAREIEGGGWAGDRASWHPQARLTAMPAWQSATSVALAAHTRLVSQLAGGEAGPDADLAAAARLLMVEPSEDMRPRLTAAAEALNRFDTRAARDKANLPSRVELLKAEAALFAGWAKTDREDLAAQIHSEQAEFPASRKDIERFYGAKARAHVAREMLSAMIRAEPRFSRVPSVSAALDKATQSWDRAASTKPLIVSNQTGSNPLFANHLASMAWFVSDAEAATLDLVAALDAMPEGGLESVAARDTRLASAAP